LTTPYDPFHAIAALAPKPREEPICCLKPLTPLEPVDDDLFLSFEDWKAKRFSESNNSQKGSAPPNDSVPDESPAEQHTPAAMGAAAHTLDASDSAPTVPGPVIATPTPPPHFRVPLTDRFNYASLDCSARVHTAHHGAKSASSILSSKRDRYMLSPCAAAQPQFVVVELCEDIRIDTVQLANFEFFSGVFREFTVSVAKTYVATDAEGWTVVGTYVGKNVRGVQVRPRHACECVRCLLMMGSQSFHPPMYIRDFYRYIRIDFHSHYSNEYYCPISLLRVYGLTHLEQWKWDMWEEESRSKTRQDPKATNTLVHADVHLGDREARGGKRRARCLSDHTSLTHTLCGVQSRHAGTRARIITVARKRGKILSTQHRHSSAGAFYKFLDPHSQFRILDCRHLFDTCISAIEFRPRPCEH
jgi:hypothetical protein